MTAFNNGDFTPKALIASIRPFLWPATRLDYDLAIFQDYKRVPKIKYPLTFVLGSTLIRFETENLRRGGGD